MARTGRSAARGGLLDELTRVATEREATGAQLREALAELQRMYRQAEDARGEARAVLDATSEAMALVSPDRVFRQVNRRFTDMFGLAPEDVVGRTFRNVWPVVVRTVEAPERFAAHVAGTASDPTGRLTFEVKQKAPIRRDIEVESSPVHAEDGEHLGRLYAFRDVTRQRELDRMKTEFVSLVSHELRTPLTSIKGYVDLLVDGELGEVAAEHLEYLRIVKSNADRLVTLTNELLDLSRIESGRIDLLREPFDLADLLREAAAVARPQLDARQQTLGLELPDAPLLVVADRDRTMQIAGNLLSNANKYTPAGGAIAVAARAEGQAARVEVRDTGIGMTADELARLFTKFFRSSNPLAREADGTGLGLAITKSLVELQGGRIEVASAPGRGSTFAFTLPRE